MEFVCKDHCSCYYGLEGNLKGIGYRRVGGVTVVCDITVEHTL